MKQDRKEEILNSQKQQKEERVTLYTFSYSWERVC